MVVLVLMEYQQQFIQERERVCVYVQWKWLPCTDRKLKTFKVFAHALKTRVWNIVFSIRHPGTATSWVLCMFFFLFNPICSYFCNDCIFFFFSAPWLQWVSLFYNRHYSILKFNNITFVRVFTFYENV